jgi:hypothetical protein
MRSSADGRRHSICSQNPGLALRLSGPDDRGSVEPGNIGITSLDAVGDFNAEPSFRPVVVGNNINQKNGDQI